MVYTAQCTVHSVQLAGSDVSRVLLVGAGLGRAVSGRVSSVRVTFSSPPQPEERTPLVCCQSVARLQGPVGN